MELTYFQLWTNQTYVLVNNNYLSPKLCCKYSKYSCLDISALGLICIYEDKNVYRSAVDFFTLKNQNEYNFQIIIGTFLKIWG